MLDNFFQPKSVAVIGASHLPGKVGHDIFTNILRYGFRGKVYPVNHKTKTVFGRKAYASVLKIREDIDLAVIAIPYYHVLEAIEECGKKQIKAAIIISAGFKEAGPEGARIERDLKESAKRLKLRILGPNCLGLIDTSSCLNASFAKGMPMKGNIAFFSQSGALCTAILDWALAEKIGFSKFVSLGNKVDVSEIDLIRALLNDPQTKVVIGYLESIERGREFISAAQRLTRKKPLIITKAGSTQAGSRAASSHTGALAGRGAAYRAAFRQAGIISVDSIGELFNFALAFSYQPLPRSTSLAIVTNGGGPGIVAADACEKKNVALSRFAKTTIRSLRKFLPSAASLYNPVDIIGDADARRFYQSSKVVIQDKNVGGLLVILTPQTMTEIKKTARGIARLSQESSKPVITSFMGKLQVTPGINILARSKIPNYHYPEDAVNSFKALADYSLQLKKPSVKPCSFRVKTNRVSKIFSLLKKEGRFNLTEWEARDVISDYGILVPKTFLAETSKEALLFAKRIGYPVAIKIASPDILHKSDIGGVRVGINNANQLKEAFQEIISAAKRYMRNAAIWGVLVQEMVKAEKELILGVSSDSQFGHLIMVGLGGIYTEIIKDTSFRIAPLNQYEAEEMVSTLKFYPLLRGVRGEAAADIEIVVEYLLRLSQLAEDFPEISELDINPLAVQMKGKGAVAIDARIILKEE